MAQLELHNNVFCSKVSHGQQLWTQVLTLSCRMIFESLWPLSTFVHIWTCIYGPCRIYIPNIGHIYMWPYIWNLYVATLHILYHLLWELYEIIHHRVVQCMLYYSKYHVGFSYIPLPCTGRPTTSSLLLVQGFNSPLVLIDTWNYPLVLIDTWCIIIICALRIQQSNSRL